MTTTQKALEDRTAAEERLVALGIWGPRDTSQDAEWEETWTQAVEEAIRTGLPVRLKSKAKPPSETGPG